MASNHRGDEGGSNSWYVEMDRSSRRVEPATVAHNDQGLLSDVVVAEAGQRLSTAYCGRLLRDLGATVIKVESGSGDPLRGDDPQYAAYLHGGKQSVTSLSQLSAVDAVVCDSSETADAARAQLMTSTDLVAVTTTDYGTSGPHASVPANELTLQAEAGIVALQRTDGRPPVMVGVPLSELVSGVNTAIGVIHALLSRDAGGGAIDVDVSRFESLVGIQQYPWLYSQIDGHMTYTPPDPTPGIEPAANGHVCIVALVPDQWTALKKMVCIPALDDPRYDDGTVRGQHRAEVSRLLRTFTSRHTVDELVDMGAQFRVPITPVATATNAPNLQPFADRKTYIANNFGGFLQPRRPYQIDGHSNTPEPPPRTGQHDDNNIVASPALDRRPLTAQSTPELPLRGIRVLEFGVFQAGPLVTAALANLGADVVKVEAVKRPDLIRFAGGLTQPLPRPWERAAAFLAPNGGKRAVTADLGEPRGLEIVRELIRRSDVVLENYAPRTLNGRGLSFAGLRALRSDVVAVRMPAWGLDGPWQERPGFTFTANAMSGMAEQTGYPDQDPLLSGTIIDPIAAQFGTLVALAAIYHRGRTGRGTDIEMALGDVAIQLTARAVIHASAGHPPMHRSGNRAEGVLYQDTVRCSDGLWIAVALRSEHDVDAVVSIYPSVGESGGEQVAADSATNTATDVLTRLSHQLTAAEFVELLRDRGVAAAAVTTGTDVVSHPQLLARERLFSVRHPVVGELLGVGSPSRFSHDPKSRAPASAPLFGQHNAEILAELGYSDAAQAALASDGVIGDSPFGMPLPPLTAGHESAGVGRL